MSRRIAIAAIGTLGDVQPFVALAEGLRAHGHEVVIGAPRDFEAMVTQAGVEFHSIVDDMKAFLSQEPFDQVMTKGSLIYAPQLLRDGQRLLKEAGQRTWRMVQDADLLICHRNTTFCIDMGEALDVAAIVTTFQPLIPTGEFPYSGYDPPALAPRPRAGVRPRVQPRPTATTKFSLTPLVNRLTYVLQAAEQSYLDLPRDRLRQSLLGLKPMRRGGMDLNSRGEQLLALHAYSPTLSPRPRDWPDRAIITGFWRTVDRSGWRPDARFRAFLDAGPRPIYLGFGSMPWGTSRNTEIIRDALHRWGGRAVISKGWGGLQDGQLPETVHVVDRAPHTELFKYMHAVVHHGGAGTTHTGLEAGCPTLIIPQFFDQPYWGKRVAALGCGPQPVRLRDLTGPGLAELLRDLETNEKYVAAARVVAARLANEHGVQRAVEVIDAAMVLHPPRGNILPNLPETTP